MARFDVYQTADMSVPYVLEVQADLLSDLSTTVVVPLVSQQNSNIAIMGRLNPIIEIDKSPYVLMTTDISAVVRKSLGKFIVNVESDYRDDITVALDFLFQGF